MSPGVYDTSTALMTALLRPFAQLHVENAESSALEGAFILACNHLSHFDPVILTQTVRRKIDWMAMIELFGHPISRVWLRAMGAFPVDRARVDGVAVRTALARLERGNVVGIFPEGGIRTGAASVLGGAPLRPGVGALAQWSGAPVVPAVILGSDQLYAARNWNPLRRAKVSVIFGAPMFCGRRGKSGRQRFEASLGAKLRGLRAELMQRHRLTENGTCLEEPVQYSAPN